MQTGIFTRLNEPFPESSNFAQSFVGALYVAVFIALFLYFFTPFGLHRVEQNLFGLCAAFGAVTLLASMSFEAVCRYIIRIETDLPNWTLWKWIARSILLVCFIALGNFLLLLWLYPDYSNEWNGFFGIVSNTLTLGVIPITFSGVLLQLRATKQHQKQAEAITTNLHTSDATRLATFEVSKNECLEIDMSAILYVESMQNYVVLHYVDKEHLKNQILRSTIGNVANQLEGGSILRCHRSYLVNTDFVEGVSGNAQGLKLLLSQIEDVEIPVSRTYIPMFKQALS